jgi:N-acetyl sugar amidotransferase
MDSSDPQIIFDNNGICNHCKTSLLRQKKFWFKNDKIKLKNLLDKINKWNKNKKYDCVIGLSGGVDSSYVAYLTKIKFGLNPLAIHLDNGWNTETSVKNIENTIKKLNIDLITLVLDWESFSDLQLAFLKASVPDAEIPTDHAIIALLYQIANKFDIKFIFSGDNVSTESVLPSMWSHGHFDWKYIKTIHKSFGTKKLKNYPHFSLKNLFFYKLIKKIQVVKILNYIDYNKEKAIDIIKQNLNWKNYGGKHEESIYTRFFQLYYLPQKFGFDKRKIHFSSLINSGQMDKQTALKLLQKPLIDLTKFKYELEYIFKKFNITEKEFHKIMKQKKYFFYDYNSYEKKFFQNYLLKFLK